MEAAGNRKVNISQRRCLNSSKVRSRQTHVEEKKEDGAKFAPPSSKVVKTLGESGLDRVEVRQLLRIVARLAVDHFSVLADHEGGALRDTFQAQ